VNTPLVIITLLLFENMPDGVGISKWLSLRISWEETDLLSIEITYKKTIRHDTGDGEHLPSLVNPRHWQCMKTEQPLGCSQRTQFNLQLPWGSSNKWNQLAVQTPLRFKFPENE
jgi:hypothetical protein